MPADVSRVAPYAALTAVFAGVFIAATDQTVVVTVLPQIMRDMQVQFNELDRASWTITGYLLGYVAAMPLVGRLSDIWGHRLVYILSMLLFMLGSALVAMSSDLTVLIASRVFQAVGAGALVPVSIAMVGDLFSSEKRGLPLGLLGASAEAGAVIGPLWGGLFVKFLSWQWIFWINIPLGAAIIALTFLLLKPSPRVKASVDFIGGATLTISLATLTLGLARVDSPDALMAIYLAATVVAFVLFLVRQKTVQEPLLPKTMFRTWTFRAANVTHFLVGGALIIGMVTIPLMANTVMGLAPIDGGLMLVRLTAAIPVGAVLGGVACSRLDYRIPTIAGLALMALGFWFMGGWEASVADPAMSAHLVTAGLGFGLVIAPLALAATNSVRTSDRGSAASMITATRIIGMTVGLAALTAWGTGRFDMLVAGISLPFALPGETPEQATQRIREFNETLLNAGLTIFNDFFQVAMALSFVAIGVTVESDGTTYANCLLTLEWTPLEPFALEYKYYAPGIGVVLEEPLDGEEPVELTSGP